MELCNRDKVMATAVVAALLLFRSYQRPSAVMGATLEEYKKAKVVVVVDGVLVIMQGRGPQDGRSRRGALNKKGRSWHNRG